MRGEFLNCILSGRGKDFMFSPGTRCKERSRTIAGLRRMKGQLGSREQTTCHTSPLFSSPRIQYFYWLVTYFFLLAERESTKSQIWDGCMAFFACPFLQHKFKTQNEIQSNLDITNRVGPPKIVILKCRCDEKLAVISQCLNLELKMTYVSSRRVCRLASSQIKMLRSLER